MIVYAQYTCIHSDKENDSLKNNTICFYKFDNRFINIDADGYYHEELMNCNVGNFKNNKKCLLATSFRGYNDLNWKIV